MTNRRMISSDMFEDEFIGLLPAKEQLAWVGIITACADDQGRFIDSPAVVRSNVFVYDREVDDELIEAVLEKLHHAHIITRYEIAGKKLIQINNWWKHQKPTWAAPSKHPSPANWVDRAKYHLIGINKVATENWDKPGGFIVHTDVHTGVYTGVSTDVDRCVYPPLSSPIDKIREEKIRKDEKREDDVPAAAGSNHEIGLIAQFLDITGLSIVKPIAATEEEYKEWTQTLVDLEDSGITADIMRQAVQEMTEKNYKIVSPKSIVKACNTAMAERARKEKGKWRSEKDGEYADAIKH